MKKRILITGANGMLGSNLVIFFQKYYNVYATGRTKIKHPLIKNYFPLNLNRKKFSDLFEWANPDIIIHCAAITNGNYCQENPKEAFDINGIAINKMIKEMGAETRIIYISTDAVFPSKLKKANENDYTNPESVYGKSKELGEFFLKQSKINFTIVRTTIVGFNLISNNTGFVEWIINSSKSEKGVELFDDVLFTPITCSDLGLQLKLIIEENDNYSSKTVHVAGSQVCSKYEFGISLLNGLGLSINHINKGTITRFKDRAKRSSDQSLDSSLFENMNSIQLPHLEKTIENLKYTYDQIK